MQPEPTSTPSTQVTLGEGSSARVDVLTIGHALVDVLARCDDAFLTEHAIAKGAMTLIDDERAAQIYNSMGPAQETSGGSAANTAVGVVNCGGTSRFVGVVSSDELGDTFVRDIRQLGVVYKTPPVDGASHTGRSYILITSDGQRSMNTNIGVSDRVDLGHVSTEALRSASITYVEGYLFDDSRLMEHWFDIARVIHESGNRFAVTLSDPYCVSRHRDLFLRLLDGSVDIMFGNVEEVRALFDSNDEMSALEALASRCDVAVMTQSERGAVLAREHERIDIPAVSTTVVDTTGAGDYFASGVLTGLAKGRSLEECALLGAKAASVIISQVGARYDGEIHLD